MEFHNLTIWKLDRGIFANSLRAEWECANVRVSRYTIVECNHGIYLNSQNCDFWKIVDCRIGANPGGHGVHLEKVGIIAIDTLLGAGNAPGQLADALIYITAAHGTVTIIGCQCEGFTNSIRLASSAQGNIAWPILVLNCTLGLPVLLAHNCDYVSLGCRYTPGAVQCVENGTDVMIYSFGDIFAPGDPNPEIPLPIPEHDFQLHGNSRVVSRSNRFRVDFQQPTRIGGRPGPPILPRLPDTALAISPLTLASGQKQMALCDAEGAVLFNVHAQQNALIFQNSANQNLMRLDGEGNLHLLGKVFAEDAP